MSLSASLFGRDSFIHKATNVLGLGIPGWLDKKFGTPDAEAQVQRIGEISNQTSKEGVPRLIIWGRVRPIGGNLIYVQAPVIKKVKQKSSSSGGKGGGSKKQPDTIVERVYRTYAIRICEGPITGIIRVWRNNKLVYDVRGTDWGAANNGVFLAGARFYLGGWDQLPDPTLQSIWGAANVPAHRGTAYMVIINEDLTDMGGSVPQYLFEAERAEGVYVTSRPYAVEDINNSEYTAVALKESPSITTDQSADSIGISLLSGHHSDGVLTYDDWPLESTDAGSLILFSGSHSSTTIVYNKWPIDSVDSASTAVIDGSFKKTVITYDKWPIEGVDAATINLIGGSHA
ncbi:MAG: hypothetical protein ACLGID_13495 [Gammaproteobacteria bacterium]